MSRKINRVIYRFWHNLSAAGLRKIGAAQLGEKNHNYGKKMSTETRKRMSESKLGIKFSKKHRENISKDRQGIKFSEEHKENMRKARTKWLEENKKNESN